MPTARWLEIGRFPIAVALQVTPIVAFFPILSNAVIGPKSADSILRVLCTRHGATPWQRLRFLQLVPSAPPYFLGSLKLAGGLSLIGAVVTASTAGSAGKDTGLASRILESMCRTGIPMRFAARFPVSLRAIVIFVVFAALAKWLHGHWHESERRREAS